MWTWRRRYRLAARFAPISRQRSATGSPRMASSTGSCNALLAEVPRETSQVRGEEVGLPLGSAPTDWAVVLNAIALGPQ